MNARQQLRQWSDKYGAQWYLHWDGIPPQDDDNDYCWNGSEWVADDYEEMENE